jgi:hypothetical protein
LRVHFILDRSVIDSEFGHYSPLIALVSGRN